MFLQLIEPLEPYSFNYSHYELWKRDVIISNWLVLIRSLYILHKSHDNFCCNLGCIKFVLADIISK